MVPGPRSSEHYKSRGERIKVKGEVKCLLAAGTAAFLKDALASSFSLVGALARRRSVNTNFEGLRFGVPCGVSDG